MIWNYKNMNNVKVHFNLPKDNGESNIYTCDDVKKANEECKGIIRIVNEDIVKHTYMNYLIMKSEE